VTGVLHPNDLQRKLHPKVRRKMLGTPTNLPSH